MDERQRHRGVRRGQRRPAKQINHTLGSYELGELISYTIELKDSVLDITSTSAAGDEKFSTPYTAASWKQDRYYFKLGSYVQLDTGPATDGGRVAFYALRVPARAVAARSSAGRPLFSLHRAGSPRIQTITGAQLQFAA